MTTRFCPFCAKEYEIGEHKGLRSRCPHCKKTPYEQNRDVWVRDIYCAVPTVTVDSLQTEGVAA
jgi:hypothetical protein